MPVGVSSSHTKGKKRVVIVGGGFAGRRAQRLLEKNFDTTLIDAKGFFEYTPAALRCMVKPSHASRATLPQPRGTVTGTVVDVQPGINDQPGEVLLGDGRKFSFDYCLIATGSSYTTPIRPDETLPSDVKERRAQFEAAQNEISAAGSVVVVGGGTVGVELAAEIIGQWPNKSVTLVASQERLLDRMPIAASVYANKWLSARGVSLVLGERVTDWGEAHEPSIGKAMRTRTLVTDQGREIQADLVYKCLGFRPCGAVASAGLCASDWESGSKPRGAIPVNSFLQVEGCSNVFAVGDCCSSPEEKNALNADLAATCASQNILRKSRGESDLLRFPGGVCHGAPRVPDLVCVSLAASHGILQFNRLVVAGRLPALAKWIIEFFQVNIAAGSRFWNAIWTAQEGASVWLGKYAFNSTDVYLPL